MQPVNEKSLLHALFQQMDKLERGEIGQQDAIAYSKLAGQAIRLYDNELKRAAIKLKAVEIFAATGTKIEVRELSSKGFDDTTKLFPDTTNYSHQL